MKICIIPFHTFDEPRVYNKRRMELYKMKIIKIGSVRVLIEFSLKHWRIFVARLLALS